MIECTVYADRGLIRLAGLIPNGVATVTRIATGLPNTVLRNGSGINVTAGGVLLEDSEGPVGVPLTYQVDITVTERMIQQNLVPTPNFTHGAYNWAAGLSRSLTLEGDPTAQHMTVGHFSNNAGGYSLASPPSVIGHIEPSSEVMGPYTLTPPTTGGDAIATNDWVYIVHQQEAAYTVGPAIPSGFTQVAAVTGSATKLVVWRRKRQVADTGYTVNQNVAATGVATCFWVRGASDSTPILSPLVSYQVGMASAVVLPPVTCINPSLIVKIAGVQMTQPGAKLTGALISGADVSPVSPWVAGNDPDSRSVMVALERITNARDSLPLTAVYSAPVADVLGFQMVVPNPTALTNRVVAKAKTTAMTAAVTSPYRFTGRVRFTSTKVWTWDDVKDNGTWDDLLADKATWADVLATEVVTTGQIARLYAVIVDPATGAYYTSPIQVIGIPDTNVNTWMDFIVYFTPTVDIPANYEIWFVHGTYSREYAMEWYLDSIGITPGDQIARHATVLYLDGDMPRPDGGAAALDPTGDWTTPLDNSAVSWSGTVGNSISQWIAPTQLRGTTTCQIDWPQNEVIPCAPVLLSDPVSSALGMWLGLLSISDLEHSVTSTDAKILNRPDPVATSHSRQWETGTLRVLTTTQSARNELLGIARSGRVLLLRNPEPDYPENNWYLSCKRITETRVSPDHRFGHRVWEIPFTRVARPTGLIESSSSPTWEDIALTWTWDQLKANRATWLDVLTLSVS